MDALGGLLAQMSLRDICENILERNLFNANIVQEHFQEVIICLFIWNVIYNLIRTFDKEDNIVAIKRVIQIPYQEHITRKPEIVPIISDISAKETVN